VAQPGEIVLDASALASVSGHDVTVAEYREHHGRRCGVLGALVHAPELPPRPPEAPPLPDDLVRPWLLPVVWERLRTGGGEFLAELRPAIPLFVRFGGLDFDNDDGARDRLHEFIVGAQRIIDSYGGAALQLTLGDKGAYLYGVFGTPVAHEDDAARACAAALELLALERRGDVADLQIGIAQGRLRSGTYGHPKRRTFCCLGDAVNLAARLMTSAAPGQVVVDDAVQRAAGEQFEWTRLPELTVKGKQNAITAHTLDRRRARRGPRSHVSTLVGRQNEVAQLQILLEQTRLGRGQVIGISAEAGFGKSRLLAETVSALNSQDVSTYQGEAQPFGTRTSYFAWTPVWSALLGVPDDDPEARFAAVQAAVAAVAPELTPRVPLLGPLVGADFPDSDLTRTFDAKLRKASLESLVSDLLRAFVDRHGPIGIVIEDCHWLDPLSGDLLGTLAPLVGELPVALLLAYRPLDASDTDARSWYDTVRGLGHWTEIPLEELDETASRQIIAGEADRLFELGGDVPVTLVDTVLARAGGNPFHVQELMTYLWSQHIDPRDDAAVRAIELPASVQGLVLSRIDMLTERVRRTAKVGSVVGRSFDLRTITGAYPPVGTLADVVADTAILHAQDLLLPEGEDETRWLFRHAVVRDVAYDSLPFALRRTLHEQVARWLERDPELTGDGRRRLDLLAHHFWFSGDDEKKLEYLTLAGDAAAADYANVVALHHYERAADLGTDAERAAVLMKLGRVQELTALWGPAAASYGAALELARSAGRGADEGAALAASADVMRKQGHFEEAAEGLRTARAAFAAAGDDTGVGRVLHLTGTLAAQQGRYDDARENYHASMAIRKRLGDVASEAALLSNLAVVAEYEGDYGTARELNEQALALRSTVGDRWSLGVSHNNLGMVTLLQDDLDSARDNFVEALRLNVEVGDTWMVAIVRNNLANVEVRLGNLPGARRSFAEAHTAYRLLGDQWALAILYEDIAALAVAAGRPLDGHRLAGAADALRERLGSPRSQTQEDQLSSVLGNGVEAGDAAVAREEMRAEPDRAEALVADLCAGPEEGGD
jgi:class 3 adenylate cyclase/tetratricopeptide (TPR) repeat protein